MNPLSLAHGVQEEVLFLPAAKKGRDPINESDLRSIAAELDWRKQRWMWHPFGRSMRNPPLPTTLSCEKVLEHDGCRLLHWLVQLAVVSGRRP